MENYGFVLTFCSEPLNEHETPSLGPFTTMLSETCAPAFVVEAQCSNTNSHYHYNLRYVSHRVVRPLIQDVAETYRRKTLSDTFSVHAIVYSYNSLQGIHFFAFYTAKIWRRSSPRRNGFVRVVTGFLVALSTAEKLLYSSILPT